MTSLCPNTAGPKKTSLNKTMKLRDSVRTALSGLAHAKTRSMLTILGIVIGIASVILLLSIGTSAQDLILSQVQGLGSNLIIVIPGNAGSSRFSSPASAQGIVIKSLKQSDIDSLERDLSVSAVTAEVRGQARVVYGENDTTVTYDGVTANFFPVRNFGVEKGYPFQTADVDSFNHVAVIGSALATTLFGNLDPVGKNIRLQDQSFRVMGVLEKKGTGAFGVDQDNMVIIPITVAQRQLQGIDYFSDIIVQGNDSYTIEFSKSRVTSILRQNHGITDPNKDDFSVRTQQDALDLLGNITSVLKIFLTSIACISLVVGGIGIMNIMLVSVIERTKEIGLRKALGATNTDIVEQFLWEAVMLTAIGGIVGILIGAAFDGLIYLVVSKVLAISWVFALPLSAVGIAALVSTLIGLLFGLYPAREAAKKSPIEALRYE